MNASLTLMFATLAAALVSTAYGQPGGGMGGMGGMGPGPSAAIDCSKARNPQHCEDRQKARQACKDLRGAARQDCMTDHMPPPDCGKSANPERCAAMQSARQSCKGKYGTERQACLKAHPVPGPRPRGGGMGPATGGMGGMGAPQ